MKPLYTGYIILLFGVISSLTSCEEIIDIDLRSVDPELAVEAIIEADKFCRVTLTRTTDYFDSGTPDPVNDAEITVSSNLAESETLLLQGDGVYTGSSFRGKPGVTYFIRIEYNSRIITGSTYLPAPTEILTLQAEPYPYQDPEEEPLSLLNITFKDNPLEINYYMLRIFRNDTLMKGHISLVSDSYNNSGVLEYTEWRYIFRSGDRARVELCSIDNILYRYFSEVNEVTGQGISFSTPYNPRSDLSGNALGYFGSWSFTTANLLVN